jgi:hypothetical protein
MVKFKVQNAVMMVMLANLVFYSGYLNMLMDVLMVVLFDVPDVFDYGGLLW